MPVQAEIIFFSWGQSISELDGYKLYEAPSTLLAILPKESTGVTIRVLDATDRMFYIKEYKGDIEGDASNITKVSSFDDSVSYCMPGTINTIELYQQTYEQLQIEKEKVISLEDLIVSYKATIEDQSSNLITCNQSYNTVVEQLALSSFFVKKLDADLSSCIERESALSNKNKDLQERVNSNMNTITALEKDKELLIQQNIALQKKVIDTQHEVDVLNVLNVVYDIANKDLTQRLYHPNGQLWKEHWCASRETICNAEDAFAGFVVCRYPFVEECSGMVPSPHP